MRFDLEGLDVFFPYDAIYKEQYEYMLNLKRAIDAKGHALLEMPTGTGKTVCLVSLITSYQFQYPLTGKLIYCTRTVQEMFKTMDEIRRVMAYREKEMGPAGGKILALCLSSRKNMCIHPRVESGSDREAVDSICRSMTASWVRTKAGVKPKEGAAPPANAAAAGSSSSSSSSSASAEAKIDETIELCGYYETYDKESSKADVPSGVYSLDDMKDLGRKYGWCPYFMARELLNRANIVVYNYQYMLDPKVANLVSKELETESIVVFDEAHNIDNVCIEAFSVILDKRKMEASLRGVNRLSAKVGEIVTQKRLDFQSDYNALVNGLIAEGAFPTNDQHRAHPTLTEDQLQEAVPGNIRKNAHFVAFLKKVVVYFKKLLSGDRVEVQTALAFLRGMTSDTVSDRKTLRFTSSRLNALMRNLEISKLEDFSPLIEVANFATLLATYTEQGFNVVYEPQGSIMAGISEPLLQLCCLDASFAIKPVLERFRSVIITSGTLSPIGDYAKLLNFEPVIKQSFPMSTFRACLLPLIVTRGRDQVPISSKYESRMDPAVIRNFGELLVDVSATVPDGVCAFFTSYSYMEAVLSKWDEWGIISKIFQHKLIFMETKDVLETQEALANFKRSCDCGRGAVFLSIARGKVAEGVDFDRHYGRAVLLFGIPIQYTQSHVLRARMAYMLEKYQIREQDFLIFDALRQAAQCVGRVIRSKEDYGIVILADFRYNKQDKRSKLPQWIQQFMRESSLNTSTDVAIEQIKAFLKVTGQPVDRKALETIVLTQEQVDERNRSASAYRIEQATAEREALNAKSLLLRADWHATSLKQRAEAAAAAAKEDGAQGAEEKGDAAMPIDGQNAQEELAALSDDMQVDFVQSASEMERYANSDNPEPDLLESGSFLQTRKAIPRAVNAQALAHLENGTVQAYIPASEQAALLERVSGSKRDRQEKAVIDMLLDTDDEEEEEEPSV